PEALDLIHPNHEESFHVEVADLLIAIRWSEAQSICELLVNMSQPYQLDPRVVRAKIPFQQRTPDLFQVVHSNPIDHRCALDGGLPERMIVASSHPALSVADHLKLKHVAGGRLVVKVKGAERMEQAKAEVAARHQRLQRSVALHTAGSLQIFVQDFLR